MRQERASRREGGDKLGGGFCVQSGASHRKMFLRQKKAKGRGANITLLRVGREKNSCTRVRRKVGNYAGRGKGLSLRGGEPKERAANKIIPFFQKGKRRKKGSPKTYWGGEVFHLPPQGAPPPHSDILFFSLEKVSLACKERKKSKPMEKKTPVNSRGGEVISQGRDQTLRGKRSDEGQSHCLLHSKKRLQGGQGQAAIDCKPLPEEAKRREFVEKATLL